MRAHHVIEGMDWLAELAQERGMFDVFDSELWTTVRAIYDTAVNFDFGDACPNVDHIEFGYDLHEKGLFQLPFDAVLISASALGTDHSVLATNFGADAGEFVCVSTSGLRINKDISTAKPIPVCLMRCTKDRVDWKQMTNLPHFKRSTGNDIGFDGDRFRAHVLFVYGAISMLMSKDVTHRTEREPARLNRSREKKGRPAVRETRFVTIRPEAAARFEGAAEAFRSGRSPRMHWRRGHIRQISDGRLVPVAPCIVNATDVARDVARKDYLVKLVKDHSERPT